MNAFMSAHREIMPTIGPNCPELSGTRRKRHSTVRRVRIVVIRKCEVCGFEFTPRRPHGRYCSGLCRQRAGRARRGGQHRPSIGTSTMQGETDTERAERHRRAYAELGIDTRVATAEFAYTIKGSTAEQEALTEFERERERLAGQKAVPF